MSASLVELLHSLDFARPELVLAGFALLATLFGAYLGDRGAALLSSLGAVVLAAAGALAVTSQPAAPVEIFQGEMVSDGFGAFGKALIGFSAAVTLALGADHFSRSKELKFEFPVLVTLAALGMFVMVSAQDLITLYIGVELQSLAAYVLAAWRRDDARSSEAGLKYFVLGAIASGLILFGASYVYGFTGSVRFDSIAAAAHEGAGVGLIFGLVLMICGLGFKMSAAPFHMWTPDVYEGAPTPVTAFFAAAPKAGAVVLLARLLYEPFASMAHQWVQVIAALSAISMLVGSFAALIQTNMKRLMAYSSIANMGFALMGLASGRPEGAAAALLYLALYLPATIGVFALILAMRREGEPAETIEDLAGLAQKRTWMAGVFTMLLFSIAGIPPLVGFWGKWVVFREAVAGGLVWLAVLGGISAVVAAAYYLRIIAAMWFKPAGAPLQGASGVIVATASAAAALTFPLLVLGLGFIERWAGAAVSASM
jgi:NADH-quinone oxidoreductase subunit N